MGTKCGRMGVHLSYVEWPDRDQAVVVSEGALGATTGFVPPKSMKRDPLDFVFVFENTDVTKAPTIEVYYQRYSKGFRTFREFYSHRLSTTLLLSVETK